jgi:hypothetical protein
MHTQKKGGTCTPRYSYYGRYYVHYLLGCDCLAAEKINKINHANAQLNLWKEVVCPPQDWIELSLALFSGARKSDITEPSKEMGFRTMEEAGGGAEPPGTASSHAERRAPFAAAFAAACASAAARRARKKNVPPIAAASARLPPTAPPTMIT